MKSIVLIAIEPQQVLVWTCVGVFVVTCIITLLGIIGRIKVEPTYLNRLFVALILEIVSIGVLAFKDSFKPAPVIEFVKLVTPMSGFSVGTNSEVYVNGAYNKRGEEVVSCRLKANNRIMTFANNSKETGIYSTVINANLLDKDGASIIILSITKENKMVVEDSVIIKK